jgi:hypothetical protein
MGLGRPGTTQQCDITCPEPSTQQIAEFEPWTPHSDLDKQLLGISSRTISVSHYNTDHLRLATEALDIIYAPGRTISRQEIESIVSRTDVALNGFYTGLPSYIRLTSSPKTPSLPHVYQLHIQYHVTHILLHRPLLARQRSGSSPTDANPPEPDIHIERCRQSASEIVKLLRLYQTFYSLRLIPIVTVHNTFTASIIHLMDAANPDLPSNEPPFAISISVHASYKR